MMAAKTGGLTIGQKKTLACLILVSATFVVFSGVLNNDFVGWDDDSYILANPFVSSLGMQNLVRMFSGFYFSSWTPLTLVSHAVDYALWGVDPRGHHLTNLIVHAVNTGWVFLVGLQVIVYARLWGERKNSGTVTAGMPEPTILEIAGALIGAVLFSWHPLRVESVACASSRKELLCAFFAFPAAYAYLSYRFRAGKPPALLNICSLLLFALALLAKSSVITWPVLLVAFEFLEARRRGERPGWGRIALRSAPFFGAAGAVAAVSYIASRHPGTPNLLGASPSLFLPPYTFWFYIQKTFWPFDLSTVYEIPSGAPLLISAAAGVLTAVAALALAWRGKPAFLVAVVFFAVTMLPVLGIVPSTIQAIANRYTYLAAPAFGILLGYLFCIGWARAKEGPGFNMMRGLLLGLTVAVTGLLVVLSVGVIGTWRDAETMWRQAVKVAPGHPVVHLDLGLTLLDKGEYGESIEQVQKAIDLKPDYAEAYTALGSAYAITGDTVRAEKAFEKSLAAAPGYYLALSRFGHMRIAQSRYREAAMLLGSALQQAPGDAFSTLCMADLCYKTGDLENALRFARAAIAIRPTYGEAYYIAAAVILSRSPNDAAGIGYLRTAATLGFQPAIQQLEAINPRQ